MVIPHPAKFAGHGHCSKEKWYMVFSLTRDLARLHNQRVM